MESQKKVPDPFFARRHVLLLVAVSAVLFLTNAWSLPLLDPEESRCGLIVRDMLRSGDWLVPRLEGKPYFSKPAPFFWLAAAGTKLTGDGELGGRLVPAIAGVLAVLVAYAFARRVFDPLTGLLSGLILATTGEFFFLARWYRMDMPFVAAMWAAIWWFWRAESRRGQGDAKAARRSGWCGFYVFCAVATLFKGPAGLGLPALMVAAYLLLSRQWRRIGDFFHLPGMGIYLLIAAPWYVAVSIWEPGYAHTFFIRENLLRYGAGTAGHHWPGILYVPIFLAGLLPWTLFLPGAVIRFFPRRWRLRAQRPELLMLWLAALAPLVFFAFSGTKLIGYILPAFPPTAVLIGGLIGRWVSSKLPDRLMRAGVALLVCTAAAACLAPIGLAVWAKCLGAWVALPIAAAAGIVFNMVAADRLQQRGGLSAWAVAGFAMAYLWTILFVAPTVYDQLSARPLARMIPEHDLAVDEVFTWSKSKMSFEYYLDLPAGRRVQWVESGGEQALAAKMCGPTGVYVLVWKPEQLAFLEKACPGRIHVVGQGSDCWLVRNRGQEPFSDKLNPKRFLTPSALDVPWMANVVIDGKADDWGDGGYRMEVLEPMGGWAMRPKGQRVQARLGWNQRGLLMLVTIWDDVWVEDPRADRLHEGDCVEAFLYAPGKGSCQWVFSPGMDPRQPALRWQLFDRRAGAALRALPAKPLAVRTRNGNECVLEILLPFSAMAIEPREGAEMSFQFWVADCDGRVDDLRHAWKARFAVRLARTASPPQRFLHRPGFNAKAMLANILVEGGPASVGKAATLVDGTRTLARATFGRDDSGGAVAELLVPERGPGSPLFGELAVLVEGEVIARLAAPDPDKGKAEGFLFSRVTARPGTVFDGPALPAVDFEDPGQVVKAIGPYSLKTTYYDRHFQPVTKAEKPGRYAAVLDVAAADGRTCRRFLTLFRQSDEPAWREKVKALNLPPAQLAQAAVQLAQLYEPPPGPSERQWWVDFKRKFYGWEKRWPGPFVCPRPKEGPPAPVVHEGTLAQAGMKADAAERIDAVLRQWAADSDEPFAACVVRHGVIVLHKAYGTQAGRAMTVDDPRHLASLTKFLSGVLLLTFVDQGLVDLDAPVANYLPPFQGVRGNRPLTIRDLYTHTSGFEWHWGAWENDLEERLAFYVPHVRVGERFLYNGTGFDLGSKVLEAISGEPLPDLYHRHVLAPLGCRGTYVPDGGASASSVPLDLARIGQMLLNKGAYGNMRFMGEQTFARLLPTRLTKVLGPDTDAVYGLGSMWIEGEGLGEGAFAHRAKSMSTLFIDPRNDLVIAMTRNRPGQNFVIYHPGFIAVVVAGLDR